jgi:hypothetical protein
MTTDARLIHSPGSSARSGASTHENVSSPGSAILRAIRARSPKRQSGRGTIPPSGAYDGRSIGQASAQNPDSGTDLLVSRRDHAKVGQAGSS